MAVFAAEVRVIERYLSHRQHVMAIQRYRIADGTNQGVWPVAMDFGGWPFLLRFALEFSL